MTHVEVNLVRGAAHVAEIGIAHLTGAVHDAAHDGDFDAFQVTGSLADAGGGFLNIVMRAATGRAGNVLRLAQAHTGGLQDIEAQARSLVGVGFAAHQHGIADAVAKQRTGIHAAGHGSREGILPVAERILEQDAVAGRDDGGQQPESLHHRHIDAVLHRDQRGGSPGQRGGGGGIARVELHRSAVLVGDFRHKVLHHGGVERLAGGLRQHDAHRFVPAQAHAAAGDELGLALVEFKGVESLRLIHRERSSGKHHARLVGSRQLKTGGNLKHRILRQRNSQGIANAIGQQGTHARGALDAGILALASLSHAQVNGVVPVEAFLSQSLHQQAVSLNHDLHVGRLHGEYQLVVIQLAGNTGKLQRTLHHAIGRVAVAVQNAVGEGAVVRPQTHGAAVLLAEEHQRGKSRADFLDFLLVFIVGVVALHKLLLIHEVAGVHADFLHPLGSLHSGIGLEVDIGHQRHIAPGGTQLAGNVFQIGGIYLGLCGEADNFAAGLSQCQRFTHAAGGIQRITGQHGLDADGIGASNPHISHHHLAGKAARILVQTRAMQRAHAPNFTPLEPIFQARSGYSRAQR